MNLEFQPEGNGFHFRITSHNHGKYWISYVAIGTGGHQMTGEINGEITSDNVEGYHRIHFPVIHVGAKALDFDIFGHANGSTNGSTNGTKKIKAETNHVNPNKSTSIIDASLVVPDKINAEPTTRTFTGTPYY